MFWNEFPKLPGEYSYFFIYFFLSYKGNSYGRAGRVRMRALLRAPMLSRSNRRHFDANLIAVNTNIHEYTGFRRFLRYYGCNMPKTCVVVGCTNHDRMSNKKLIFFQLPKRQIKALRDKIYKKKSHIVFITYGHKIY